MRLRLRPLPASARAAARGDLDAGTASCNCRRNTFPLPHIAAAASYAGRPMRIERRPAQKC
eukprot:23525-Chlamydomonas_euryale.AAC.11